jgi:hypothetical protein
MNARIVLLSVMTIASLESCDNSSAPDCLQSSGQIITEEVTLPAFNTIILNDDIDIYIGNGSGQRVFVRLGENLIPEIRMEVNNNKLVITNDNTCNWLREPGNPGIYIYSDSISKIESYAYNNIISLDTLRFRRLDLFTDGNGDFKVKMEGDSLYVRSEFISNFYISGSLKFLRILFLDDSQFHGKDLVCDWIRAYQLGSNVMEIFPVEGLLASIESTGSIYYYNDPVNLDISITGTGKLIRK